MEKWPLTRTEIGSDDAVRTSKANRTHEVLGFSLVPTMATYLGVRGFPQTSFTAAAHRTVPAVTRAGTTEKKGTKV